MISINIVFDRYIFVALSACIRLCRHPFWNFDNLFLVEKLADFFSVVRLFFTLDAPPLLYFKNEGFFCCFSVINFIYLCAAFSAPALHMHGPKNMLGSWSVQNFYEDLIWLVCLKNF